MTSFARLVRPWSDSALQAFQFYKVSSMAMTTTADSTPFLRSSSCLTRPMRHCPRSCWRPKIPRPISVCRTLSCTGRAAHRIRYQRSTRFGRRSCLTTLIFAAESSIYRSKNAKFARRRGDGATQKTLAGRSRRSHHARALQPSSPFTFANRREYRPVEENPSWPALSL